MGEYKKVKNRKEFGVWYYEIIKPSCWNDLDGNIYRLFDSNIETKEIL